MTHPRRAIDYTPRRRWPALAAAGVLLTSGGIGAAASLPAQADTHETPTPTPPALLLAAEPGPACGTVQLDILGSPMEVYRAITKESVAGEDVGHWIRQPRDPDSRIDSIIPSGYWVVYRAQTITGPDVYTEPVQTEQCPEPTPDPTVAPSTPSTSPTPSPSPSSSADPSPSASAGSAAPSSPAPATKDSEGGLAATGVDR